MKNLKLYIGIKYGLITSVLSVLINMALAQMGTADFSGGGNFWIALLIVVLGFYLASEEFKKKNEGYFSLGQGVQVGLWIGATVGLISGIFSIIYLQMDPSLVEKVINQIEARLEEENANQEAVDMAVSLTRKMMSPGILMFFSMLMNVFIGLLVGTVASIFVRKEKPIF